MVAISLYDIALASVANTLDRTSSYYSEFLPSNVRVDIILKVSWYWFLWDVNNMFYCWILLCMHQGLKPLGKFWISPTYWNCIVCSGLTSTTTTTNLITMICIYNIINSHQQSWRATALSSRSSHPSIVSSVKAYCCCYSIFLLLTCYKNYVCF